MKISHASAPSAAASATAVVSEPPRPSVVTSCVAVETPWKPATSTILSAASAAWIRSARTSTIFALVCDPSVTMPACEPVSETASWPRSWIAIAQSAFEIRSPVEMSMSYSRGCGRGETSCASRISSSVVSPIAESTATTFAPDSRAAASRCATRFSLSVSPTDEPPNFITISPGVRVGLPTAGIASKSVVSICDSVGAVRNRLGSLRAWVIVVFGAIGIFLVPWAIWLGATLRPDHTTDRWDVVWTGFDVGLALAFALTALAAWRRSPWVGALAATTGTLLLVDAWFDIVLESHGKDIRTAIMRGRARRAPGCRRSATGSPIARRGSSPGVDVARADALHLAAAGERPAEGDLVGVLEVAADREPAREARDPNPIA